MIRVDNILENLKFDNYMNRNFQAEKERIFCHHDIQHLIDVARVAYIIVLENNLKIEKDIIYATALLHDIGRWKEYEEGVDHAKVSAELALDILLSSGFESDEIEVIITAIRNHRKKGQQRLNLSDIIYKSDKICRLCMKCLAKEHCKRFSNNEKFELIY